MGRRLRARRSPSECVPVGYAVNPQVACVTPMMCTTTRTRRSRRGLEGANFFGYSLAHFYVFGEHRPGRDRRVGRVPASAAPQMGYSPEADRRAPTQRARSAPRSPPATTTGPARRDRHARPGARVPAPLRGGRRRPAHLRAAGRHATATSTSWSRSSCSAARCCPSSPSATRRQVAGEGRAARAGHRGGDGPQARHHSRRADIGDYSFPAIPRQWADATHDETLDEWLEQFADDRAAGKRDDSAGIAG